MRKRLIIWLALLAGLWTVTLAQTLEAPNDVPIADRSAQAVIVTCHDMIDRGLFESIKRRANQALDMGADYLILEIKTYGGELKTADDIAKLLILDLAKQIRTVAYVATEAISAGALISVSCQDIVMRENSTIGDCAPITMGGKLEGVEREKVESFTRAMFDRAAKANDYPQALLRAMVTKAVEVYRVQNRESGEYEFFETAALPTDANAYDLEGKELVDPKDRILTVDAATAEEYGIARAVVPDRQGLLDYLAERDDVTFTGSPTVLETNWSEEMVRKINHPAVIGILTMVALLGLYIEFSTPGLGLPGLAAVIAFVVIIGSKYLHGMANWVEVAVFVVGVALLFAEIFIIPGFGVAGIAGIICMVGGLFGMLVRNPPERLPWPETDMDWNLFTEGLLGFASGFVGFVILAVILARYLPRLRVFSGLILMPSTGIPGTSTASAPDLSGNTLARLPLQPGDIGESATPLHPTGRVYFEDQLVDCVAQGEFLDKGIRVRITKIRGNRIVVEAASEDP